MDEKTRELTPEEEVRLRKQVGHALGKLSQAARKRRPGYHEEQKRRGKLGGRPPKKN